MSLGKVPGLARQRWEMYRAGFACWSLIGLHVAFVLFTLPLVSGCAKSARCVMLVSSFVGVTGARYSCQGARIHPYDPCRGYLHTFG